MLGYYEKLLELKCFSHKDAMALFGESKKTTNILYSLKKKGLIQSVRRNLYVVISLETKAPVATAFEIAAHITPGSYISHHSAFEFYGMANQVFSDVCVSSDSFFRTFDFDDHTYRSLVSGYDFGITEQKRIRVTDLERTVLDNIKEVDKVGGMEELLRCLSMITVILEKTLMEYLEKYQNQFLYQKAGYILSHFPRLKLSGAFFDFCKQNKGKSSRYLYSDLQQEDCIFNNEWRLCVPKDLMSLISEGGEELV